MMPVEVLEIGVCTGAIMRPMRGNFETEARDL